jgi:hypothetical protein
MTRAEAKEAFNHVLDTVLDRGDSSSLKRSLIEDGIIDIFDLLNVTDDVIDSLAYEDPNDKMFYPVKKGDKILLRCFLAYQQSLEPATGNVDYKAITQSHLIAIALVLRTGQPFTSLTPLIIICSFLYTSFGCYFIPSFPLFSSGYVLLCHQEGSFIISSFEG